MPRKGWKSTRDGGSPAGSPGAGGGFGGRPYHRRCRRPAPYRYHMGLAREYGVEAEFHLDESGNRALSAALCNGEDERNRVTGTSCGYSLLYPQCPQPRREKGSPGGHGGLFLEGYQCPYRHLHRNLAPVKELLAAGVPVGIGSDNVGISLIPSAAEILNK